VAGRGGEWGGWAAGEVGGRRVAWGGGWRGWWRSGRRAGFLHDVPPLPANISLMMERQPRCHLLPPPPVRHLKSIRKLFSSVNKFCITSSG